MFGSTPYTTTFPRGSDDALTKNKKYLFEKVDKQVFPAPAQKDSHKPKSVGAGGGGGGGGRGVLFSASRASVATMPSLRRDSLKTFSSRKFS